MPKAAFYAVKAGRVPGIYGTWGECEAQVKGFSKAVYQSFKTRAQAEEYMKGVPGPASLSNNPPPAQSSSSSSSPASKALTDIAQLSNEGWNLIYTDGACRGNGKANARAGVGVWFGDGDPRNISERCPGHQTNNRAELIAIIRALEATPTTDRIAILTDSVYCQNCIEQWLPKWVLKGFRTASGGEVLNREVIEYLSELISKKPPKTFRFMHVPAHSGIPGNEGADTLAVIGCEKPWREEDFGEWDISKIQSSVAGSAANASANTSQSFYGFSEDDIPTAEEEAAEVAAALK
ncbi:hypothetical protein DL93DRAFT_2075991 [Clavulina sp. PMI_390]|nr:hypothetical protein DL93DRAFT_2075991 [Clavulina sp. PMI_390]